jgi:methylenetetrahydrofolate reductase (NADPH)
MDASAAETPRVSERRLADLLGAASIEIAPHDELAGDALGDLLPAGRTVFVNHPASANHHAIVAACARLRRAGFVPVPHVAARRLTGFTQARDFLERAAAEAEIGEVLIVGGDPDRPLGPFGSSLELLASGVVERCGIGRVAFAGYPEGHPAIAPRTLEAALDAKLALARRLGLDASIVTQFGFASGPIHRWIADLRARGIRYPVRVGLAGPSSVASLAKYAVRCGVGASLRALARGHAAFARIVVETGPDALLHQLIAEEDEGAPIDAVHIFTFGGVRRTAEWIRAAAGSA